MQARNIRSVAGFIRGLWDWTFLNECFAPTKIRVADVDGVVERKGHFLWLEAKPERETADRDIPAGQLYTHQALAKTGAFTVITIWGTTDTDIKSEYLRQSDTTAMICALGEPTPTYARVQYEDGKIKEGPTTKQELKETVRRWFEWANQHPK